MLISRAEIVEGSLSHGSWDRGDPVVVMLRAICSGETPIVAIHPAKPLRTKVVNRLALALRQENVRVIQAMSLDGHRIELSSFMDQVVGGNCKDLTERSEKCHAALTSARGNETRIALIIDDAHLITEQTLRYLDLVALLGKFSRVPLQITLLGGPEIYEKLPRKGALSAEKAALRIELPDDFGEPGAEQRHSQGVDASEPIVSSQVAAAATVEPAAQQYVPEVKAASCGDRGSAIADGLASRETFVVEDVSVAEAGSDVADKRIASPFKDVPAGEEAPAVADASLAGERLPVEAAEATPPLEACPAIERLHGPEETQVHRADTARHEPTETVAGPRTAAEGSGIRKPSKGSTPARRGRLALVACVGVIVIGGGLGVDRILDEPTDEPNLLQSIARGHLGGWLGRSDPMQPSDVAASDPVVAAASQRGPAGTLTLAAASDTAPPNAAASPQTAGQEADRGAPAPSQADAPAAHEAAAMALPAVSHAGSGMNQSSAAVPEAAPQPVSTAAPGTGSTEPGGQSRAQPVAPPAGDAAPDTSANLTVTPGPRSDQPTDTGMPNAEQAKAASPAAREPAAASKPEGEPAAAAVPQVAAAAVPQVAPVAPTAAAVPQVAAIAPTAAAVLQVAPVAPSAAAVPQMAPVAPSAAAVPQVADIAPAAAAVPQVTAAAVPQVAPVALSAAAGSSGSGGKVEDANLNAPGQPAAAPMHLISPGMPPVPEATGSVAAASGVPASVVAILIQRGDGLLATGDVNAARLMYQRAAGLNSAQGAVALGMTYDPRFLARLGAQGIVAEPQRAIVWYRRAADLGSADANRLLMQLRGADTK